MAGLPDPFEGRSEPPSFHAGHYVVRPILTADAPAIYALFSDPEVTRYWSHGPFREPAEAEAWIACVHKAFAERSMLEWGVAESEQGPLIGTCALANWVREHRRAEIGYALQRHLWGRGVMAEVLPELIRFGFETMGLHRIEADVDPRNAPSIRSLERLGFQREGYLRERYHVNGETQDAALYGLLRTDFLLGPVETLHATSLPNR